MNRIEFAEKQSDLRDEILCVAVGEMLPSAKASKEFIHLRANVFRIAEEIAAL